MAGLVPAIHVFTLGGAKDVDPGMKPGMTSARKLQCRANSPKNRN
jgi:hypothetical protein